jgi:glycosyltransferase involved in cell wall biosynthesis
MEVLPQFVLPVDEPATTRAEDRPPHPRPYFLFVGRLERMKGLDDVVSAFEQFGDADLLVAGEGEYGPELKQRASGNARIVFLGRLEKRVLDDYYRHAIALIVPSVGYETFGLTIIEAFQHGTPVIARRVGPLQEIIEPAGGGMTFETVDELVFALRSVQGDPARRAALGDQAFGAYQSCYTARVVVPRFLDLSRKTIEAHRRNRLPAAWRVGSDT